jgi:hypothetical protein
MSKGDRRAKNGALLGPRRSEDWLKWRVARDKRIAQPRRLKLADRPADQPVEGGSTLSS